MSKVVCVTGTPGCGKTELCLKLQKKMPSLQVVNIGELIKEKQLYSEWDDEMDCSIFDEKLVNKELRKIFTQPGRYVVDFHSVGFIRPKFVHKVVCLEVETNILWDRLALRGYEEKKIQENVQAEIFKESFNDAIEQFDENIVSVRPNNTLDEQKVILKELIHWLKQ